MLVSTKDGKTFTLTRENEADHQFLDALDFSSHVCKKTMLRAPATDGQPGWVNQSAVLEIDSASPSALRAYTAGQALSTLGDLLRLGLAEAAKDGLVCPDATYPQAQKALAASLEELKLMVETLRVLVFKQEAASKEVCRAHSELLSSGLAIVTQVAA